MSVTRKLALALAFCACTASLATMTMGCQPKSKAAQTKLIRPDENGPAAEPKIWTRTILAQSYHIDRRYPSMKGPSSIQKVKLLDVEKPELLWIVGYEAIMMNSEGTDQVSQEFMCHSNLDFEPRTYWDNFKSDASMSGRLFTLSQGQQKVRFPRGTGIPVTSETSLDLATQVLNLNLDNPSLDVRHKVTIEFVRDSETTLEMKPLFQAAVQGFKAIGDNAKHYGVKEGDESEEEHGSGCSVGLPAVKGDVDEDRFHQKFTGHWVVKPGREENRTLVTNFLQLQFDTKIFYIAIHLHPFAESLELIDRTEKKTVYKAVAKQTEGKIGLAHITHFESDEGIPIYKDHEYELVSIYNNTTNQDTDSMAVMYMYLQDLHFQKPTPEDLMAAKERAEKEAAEGKSAPEKAKKGM
jgi:hypothetical protein